MFLMGWNFDNAFSREGTDCIKYDMRKEFFGSDDVIPMWVADMDFPAPDFITDALQKRVSHKSYGYSFRPHKYYSSIASWMASRHNWKINTDWICFSPGIVPALNLCTLAFTRPGEKIIVQPPVYFPFFSAVEANGRELVYNQLKPGEKWEMDLKGLESLIDKNTRMIIICNPHNPVGRVWTRDELTMLSDICLKNNIIILSDEIHCDLALPGNVHTPVASLSDRISEITVTCIAPSKTFNLAGLSTSSVIISNAVLRQYFQKKISDLHIGNGNIFGTVASIAAYSEGHRWLDSLMAYIDGNIRYAADYFFERIPEIVPVLPEATYMMWLDCRKLGLYGKDLQKFFTGKAKVGLNEGSTFGPGGEGFMRMNLATRRSVVEKAMNSIETAVSEWRNNKNQ
jgi:cystathionine beta-lyase